jgi:tetratricopeptide (TPR) repeat protein
MPIDPKKSGFYSCCSQYICMGCAHANRKSNINDPVEAQCCPFCREPVSRGNKKDRKRLMKRVKANDPVAMKEMGGQCRVEGDYDGAFKYLTKAAELGDLDAHYRLGWMYEDGEGVEKDEEKAVFHYEKAAIGGHHIARHNLGCIEGRNGNIERSVKHFIIGANLGDENSMKALWKHYSAGNITKDDLEATLRSHHAAIDATKSEQREEAEKVGTEHLRQMGLILN